MPSPEIRSATSHPEPVPVADARPTSELPIQVDRQVLQVASAALLQLKQTVDTHTTTKMRALAASLTSLARPLLGIETDFQSKAQHFRNGEQHFTLRYLPGSEEEVFQFQLDNSDAQTFQTVGAQSFATLLVTLSKIGEAFTAASLVMDEGGDENQRKAAKIVVDLKRSRTTPTLCTRFLCSTDNRREDSGEATDDLKGNSGAQKVQTAMRTFEQLMRQIGEQE